MSEKLSWGIIGTGNIAKTFANGVIRSKTGKLVAIASRDKTKAEKFAEDFNIPQAYGKYEDLLADSNVQAVYIATPHPMHAEWAIKAAEAKKHILCEKPLGINHAEAMAIIESAIENNVFLMEAFMYRCHPQTKKLIEILRENIIGDIKVIQATFSFQAQFNPKSRLFNNDLGGGGILDVGCYCTSMSRLIAGVACGKEIAEPIELKGCGHIGETGVDEWAIGSIRFPQDIVAQISCGVAVAQENVVRIFGTKGYIFIPSPWVVSREGGESNIIVQIYGEQSPRKISIKTDNWLYSIEADTVAENIENRQAKFPAMTFEDTLGNMKALDMWRQSIGLVYEKEKPEKMPFTVSGRKLQPGRKSCMKYGEIKGLDKKISRVIMGADNQTTFPHAAVMFDDFVERGGNSFDTAFIYAGGLCEKILGDWVKSRNIRKDIIIIGKGAHTPYCTPEYLTKQLLISLQRMQTDYIDIYLLHRDNPDISVGEFIDVLNEHKKAGRIKIFGASNWTLKRVDQANEYAKKTGLEGFSVVSNNFSLARMIRPVWAGVVSSTDKESRQWFEKNKMPLIAWSSQARGFFTGRYSPEDKSDPTMVECWYSDDNFMRLERVKQLAEKLGVEPTAVALAYVLCQKFPTFALIGPRSLSETRTSLKALEIELTEQQIKWLNLEE
ncbi:MAG TPA: aldo/keto reductase [Candidatus Ratteibacteria bacterium]|jgi:predicted dehydrogenase/aryl-alcohol dehydrogenase-like predicted oxidoreductase|nr:aldo/keto reductase [bacterium]HPC28879.1 aldo/keto reductase [bacterium]HRS05565.1 aldo/keto reductase [Candidatus Ratteibacteria bacterium]HRV04118.1 aldo/keto reductase [Candidatus Ratteibacteria bacterium]